MASKSAEAQARDFLYELTNCASEYGFGKEDSWLISLASEKQKAVLEKKYYPVISALLAPDMIPMMPALVGSKLNIAIIGLEQTSINPTAKGESQYLIAYSAQRTLN